MRKIISLFIIIFVSVMSNQIQAQDSTKTLLHFSKIKSIGIYGDFNAQYGQLKNEFTGLKSGSLMILFNKRFAIGGSIQDNINPRFSPSSVNPLNLHTGIAGLKLEYVFMPNSPVHFSIPLVAGLGWARADSSNRAFNNNHRPENRPDSDNFFVLQPGAQVEVNLLKFVKLYVGANYRFSFGAASNTLPDNTLQGFSVLGGIKIGLFEIPVNKKKNILKN